MALISPGVQVTIIDESQYIPAATNSVPYILLATAQNKVSGAGVGVAAGTLEANANKTYLITSQRDLSATFGVPFFYKTTAGTPINGYELNEYGLLAAYSALGVSNRCYVQRANIDLSELTATLVRPTGFPNNNTYWLDTVNTSWGIFQWNQTTRAFTNQIPSVITDTANLQSNSSVPLDSIGNIGDYAVVTAGPESLYNLIYYKRGGPSTAQAPGWLQEGQTAGQLFNTWVLVGSDTWKTAWATIQGTNAPSSLTAGSFAINDIVVTVNNGDNSLAVATTINGLSIPGVYAAAIGGSLQLYADSTSSNDGSSLPEDVGIIAINNVSGTPLATLGITAGQYAAPDYQSSYSYQVPRWSSTDTTPEPTGSVWIKTSNVNQGTNIVIRKFDATLGVFVQQACPVYQTDLNANNGEDPSGGGANIPAGTTYARVDAYTHVPPFIQPLGDRPEASFEILERFASGPTIITGSDTTPGPFVSGNTFSLGYSTGATQTVVTVTLSGTTVDAFLTSISSALGAGTPVSASLNSSGAVVFTHSQGGVIVYYPGNNGFAPLTSAGFTPGVTRGVRNGNGQTPTDYVILSNWVTAPTFTYQASATAPDQDPNNGQLWYYSATNEADIMIQNNGAWRGYQTVTNDVRGDNLTLTNATGPIFAATAPTTQTNDSQSPLQYGDLWIDTSDLENYPVIYRWSTVNGNNEWVQIDNTDQTTENGILFADARWAPNGTTNPITDPIPPIASGTTPLITSSYLDLDAPTPDLYPQGTLLFNTRRSGFNVKSFQVNYFNSTTFPEETLPAETNAWVTASGNKIDGSPNMGRLAQRALIVAALKSGIDASTTAREEQLVYNLISCPQYPELTANLVALNDERNNTAFVVADTPLRLTPNEVVNFATNNNGLGLPAQDGLITGSVTGSIYAGAFYPSCQTTDLSGSPVVQPPSHMMIRTIIRSDEVAFPWLAPAGTRRGVIDNATQIGYINAQTGEFESLGVRQGLRDILYENRINPITFVPGVGITNFGNKTLTSVTSALDRINVARLVAFVRGRLEVIAKQYLFEPNDQITRNEITNAITSLMIDLVAKRGIYDYLVVCDLTNNTPARIDRNELYVDIAIEPVKAVEFIYIPVRIKNTGEIASQSV
jgi:hypothetical protein